MYRRIINVKYRTAAKKYLKNQNLGLSLSLIYLCAAGRIAVPSGNVL